MILCSIGISILSECELHRKLLNSNVLEEKRKLKKKQKWAHIFSILGWLFFSGVWVYIPLPTISWWLYAIIAMVMIVFPLTDVYTTFKIIGENNNKEMNPVGKYIMKKWGRKGSYIQVCFGWVLIWSFIYFVNIEKPHLLLSYIFAVITIYAGIFTSNYMSYVLMKKCPDLYWYTEWFEGKKVFGEPPK